jgi:hypothetical protein
MPKPALHPISPYIGLRNAVRAGRLDVVAEYQAARLVRVIAEEIARAPARYAEAASPLTADRVFETARILKDTFARFGSYVADNLDAAADVAHSAAFPVVDPFIPVPGSPAGEIKLTEGRPEIWVPGHKTDWYAFLVGRFTQAFVTAEATRIRTCPVGSEMFYAARPDQTACTPEHSNVLRQRRFRRKMKEPAAPAARSGKQGARRKRRG